MSLNQVNMKIEWVLKPLQIEVNTHVSTIYVSETSILKRKEFREGSWINGFILIHKKFLIRNEWTSAKETTY